MFKTRLLSGILLVIIALVTIISGGDVLFATVLLISLIGMMELYRILDLHKTLPGSLALKTTKNSNEIFKKYLECDIIFVKYATKAERMLRAAEMREKPI